MPIATDLNNLQLMINALAPGNVLRNVLTEVQALVPRIHSWEYVPTSGSSVTRFDFHPVRYEIRYQEGNLGNLVHELTHSRVNEAYDQDYIDYYNPTAHPSARTLTGDGRYCTNEAERKAQWRDEAQETWLRQQLLNLHGHVNGAGLTAQQGVDVRERMQYGSQWQASWEHDTVINQTLVWFFQWGYPIPVVGPAPPPPQNVFYNHLQAVVNDAYTRRTTRTSVNPGAAPIVPAPPPPLIAPLVAPPTKKKCYLTSACLAARELQDDCEELMVLRRFRDGWLRTSPIGTGLINEYYRTAPRILERIESRPDARKVLANLYGTVALCVGLIRNGQNEEALDTYLRMYQGLVGEYLS
jgi:hypothetical protein